MMINREIKAAAAVEANNLSSAIPQQITHTDTRAHTFSKVSETKNLVDL